MARHPVADKSARQRFIGSSIWLTVPGTYVVLAAAYAILPPLQGQEEPGARLLLAVRWLPVAMIPYAAVCIAILFNRFLEGAHNPLLGAESERLKIQCRVMQNTLEQLVWFALCLVPFATYLAPVQARLIPILCTFFAFARFLYWWGYLRHGTLGRALGVQLTFSLNIALLAFLVPSLLAGCAATTSFTFTPAPQPAVCQRGSQSLNALVLWGGKWRIDQKEVNDREVAAQAGIDRFFRESGCFAQVKVHRLASAPEPAAQAAAAADPATIHLVLVILVRELGPIVRLGSSAALIEGGTEVVLAISVYEPRASTPVRAFSSHWQNGGPGVLKGVASLPADMESALAASLQPERR